MNHENPRYDHMTRYDQTPRPASPASRVVAWVLSAVVVALTVVLVTSLNDSPDPALPGLAPALAGADACGGIPQAGAYGVPTATAQATPPGQPAATAAAAGATAPSGTAAPGASPGASAPACHAHGGGPAAADFVDILLVQPSADGASRAAGSGGSFTSQCGRNEGGHRNSDNFITAPGVVNGAHHVHDYVGNVTANGTSTDESLAAGDTTCRLGDQSTYFWPVLRRIGTVGTDAGADGGGKDGNLGEILTAEDVRLEFLGNARDRVEAMPRFLRMLTGDAKAVTNGPKNVRAQWTCEGFPDRVTRQYPVCPDGRVQRVLEFPSCWDGQNLDSANHRTHVAFPGKDGACAEGTVAVPQLRMTLTYSVPSGRSYALDSFPEQLHNPATDHGDFVNVMPRTLMALAVDCINAGRRC